MKNCLNCGNELNDTAKFCGKCGNEIIKNNSETSSQNTSKFNWSRGIIAVLIAFIVLVVMTKISRVTIDIPYLLALAVLTGGSQFFSEN